MDGDTELQLSQIDWFAGVDADIAGYAAFNAAAASVTVDDFPEVIQTDDGGIFALRLDEIIAARLDEFENAKPRADSGWRRATTVEALVAQAETVAEALRNGTDVTGLGVTLVEQTDITRESFVADAPADFLVKVFEMEAGTVQIVPADTFVQIVRLDEILPPDTEADQYDTRLNALTLATTRELGNDILNAFATAIEAEAGIALDQGAINAVHTQIP